MPSSTTKARPSSTEAPRPMSNCRCRPARMPFSPHHIVTLPSISTMVPGIARSSLGGPPGRPRAAVLRRDVEVAEEQIGEERRFGGDERDHPPPARRQAALAADRQRLAAIERFGFSSWTMSMVCPRRASGHSQTIVASSDAASAAPKSHHECSSMPMNTTTSAIDSSSGASESPGMRRMTSGTASSARGADGLAPVVEQEALGGRALAGLPGHAAFPERMAAADGRDDGEVVGRRRRGRRPFQRRRVPRVCAGALAMAKTAPDVDQEEQHAEREQEGAERDDEVERAPAKPVRVGVDAARHAHQTERCASGRSRR